MTERDISIHIGGMLIVEVTRVAYDIVMYKVRCNGELIAEGSAIDSVAIPTIQCAISDSIRAKQKKRNW